MRIEESLNVTFDESLHWSPSLQVNVLDEGYPKIVKEARGHPIEQVIGELNERTLSFSLSPRQLTNKMQIGELVAMKWRDGWYGGYELASATWDS
ncbi:hypothetical protein Tco_1340230 [Tanacetum coccineum]